MTRRGGVVKSYLMIDDDQDMEYNAIKERYDKIKNYPRQTEQQERIRRKAFSKLKKDIEYLICMYEVEHFLEFGPGGQDPL